MRNFPNDPSDVVDVAHRLMAIESTSGSEQRVVDFTADMLRHWEWDVELIPVGADGRACVFAKVGEDFDVTLSTHLDTVPPYTAPRLDGGLLRGRGACDAKGIAAAMMAGATTLRAQGVPVALLFVIGEETNHDGAHAANRWITVKHAVRPRVLINGEPTESTLGLGTKGAQRLTITTHGVAAHSAYPAMGRSATRDLVTLLAELDTLDWPVDPLLGETTVNIGHLSGGVADNVFAPEAVARLMFRLVSDPGVVRDLVTQWVGTRASIEWGVMVPPVRLGVVDGFSTSVAAFATDIPALTNWGTPYLFGPGSIHVAHTAHESIAMEELRAASGAYHRLALAALSKVSR